MDYKDASWRAPFPSSSFFFLFISSDVKKLTKTGWADLCSESMIDGPAPRVRKGRCSETPTFVIGFSTSRRDRHLAACRPLSRRVHLSHNWGGEGSTSPAWLFLHREEKHNKHIAAIQIISDLFCLHYTSPSRPFDTCWHFFLLFFSNHKYFVMREVRITLVS